MAKYSIETIGYMLEEMNKKQDQYKKEADEFREKMESIFVTRTEFAPIKLLVYGATSIILMSVFGALVALVIQK